MSSFVVAIVALSIFLAAYHFYGRFVEKLFGVDAKKKTPAHTSYDGVDYVPAKHWTVLFGHHFSSIAGAGPVVGPVLAVSVWGWGPAVLWIIIGTVFIGGIHDFGSLITSIRHKGNSIAEVAEEVLSKRARYLFTVFLWLALVLVISIFTIYCAKTFVAKPEIVMPSVGLIPVAVLVGFLLYNLKKNQAWTTALGLGLLGALIFLGSRFPISLGENGYFIWCVLLFIYCYAASITPVQILLQPRDYLSAFLLIAGVFIGYAGIFVSRPDINMDFFVGLKGGNEGFLWPMLFVTVACGAISGFHSLIASGTTSKQLDNERDAVKIGYGAMVMEGAVAILAILCIAAGIASHGRLCELVSTHTPVGAFGQGYGELTRCMLGGFGGLFAMMILNAFILTTLDSATRIARYITEELTGIKNRYLSTIIIVAAAAAFVVSGEGNKIWPVFGASNQLVAALALIVLSAWLLARKKPVIYTLLPCVFMLVTTVAALALQVLKFYREKDYLLSGISSILLVLAFYMVAEALISIKRRKAQQCQKA